MADIVVVGAGPAGSIAAKILSDYGFSVSLYEKEKLPRHKHCGGLITNEAIKTLDSIGVNCRDILSQRLRGWRLQFGDEIIDLELNGSEDDLTGNVYREEFDYFLTRIAVESGTRVIDSTEVLKIVIPENKKEKYMVVTQKGREECEIILGSDGIKSIVRRHLGIPYPKCKWAVTIEAEIPAERRVIESFNDKNFGSINYFQEGVAWAFPKNEGRTINVGIGVSIEEAKRMDKPLFGIWKRFLQDQEWYKNQSVQHHVEVMPFKGTTEKLGYDKILLLGDAAGLVDPFRGEGISYAIESSLNAAEAVKLQLEGKASLLVAYNDLMKDVLDEINVYGMKLHNNFYVKNRLKTFSKIMKKNKNMRDLMLKLSCGLISNKKLIENFSLSKLILAYLRAVF